MGSRVSVMGRAGGPPSPRLVPPHCAMGAMHALRSAGDQSSPETDARLRGVALTGNEPPRGVAASSSIRGPSDLGRWSLKNGDELTASTSSLDEAGGGSPARAVLTFFVTDSTVAACSSTVQS